MAFAGATEIIDFARRRIFVHVVLGRLGLLFLLCHPATASVFASSKFYLENRYPNRDLALSDALLRASEVEKKEFYSSFRRSDSLTEVIRKTAKEVGSPASAAYTKLAFAVAPAFPMQLNRLERPLNNKRRTTCRSISSPSMLLGWVRGKGTDADTVKKPYGAPLPSELSYTTFSTLAFDSESQGSSVGLQQTVSATADGRLTGLRRGIVSAPSLTALASSAFNAYDDAMSFVGCALVTHPIGKLMFGSNAARIAPVSSSSSTLKLSRTASSSMRGAYDLVGFMDMPRPAGDYF